MRLPAVEKVKNGNLPCQRWCLPNYLVHSLHLFADLVLSLLHLSDARLLVSTTLGLYAQSVNSSMVEAQESMLKAILRNGSNAVN